MQCDECHVVPVDQADQGHRDTPRPAELTWGPLATADGAAPGFDEASLTCTNTYCHGETLQKPGGLAKQPDWTLVDGSQAACDSCHGNPPGGTHTTLTTCELCHDEVIGPPVGGIPTWVAPERHIDGIVDIGAACDVCHGNPPTPATEDYPGGGGAHTLHAVTLGYACITCHGNDGTGPTHGVGGTTVVQANIDIVFDPTVTFPGGTTMENGGLPSENYNAGNPTCLVGCHNPVPGDVPDLANAAVWTDTTISCAECHEKPGTEPPTSHDLDPDIDDDATIRVSCQVCHNVTNHLAGLVEINDPDPADSDSYSATGASGLCRTCHDGGPGTFFGGLVPQDQSSYWSTPCSHDTAGNDCSDCHGHHGRATGEVLVNREEDLCYSCHDGATAQTDIAALFTRTSRHPVDDADQILFPVECIDCHNPHTDTQAQPFILDPDPSDGIAPAGVDVDYCLTCHDGGQARDRTVFLQSAHFGNVTGCVGECHVADAGNDGVSAPPVGTHGSIYPSLTVSFEEATCQPCHVEADEMNDANTPTHHHVVDAEQTGTAPLECSTCHEVHTDKNVPWQPIIDPNTGVLMPEADVPHDSLTDPALAQWDNDVFCLTCHDGSWPGAADIASELADQNIVVSSWVVNNNNKHFSHKDDPNSNNGEVACTYCHDAHGSTGSSGINRGMTLYNWLTVEQYPYQNKQSCSMTEPLGVCH
jgi:predicted CxxxxCH...CXXCH cytochrome family protein